MGLVSKISRFLLVGVIFSLPAWGGPMGPQLDDEGAAAERRQTGWLDSHFVSPSENSKVLVRETLDSVSFAKDALQNKNSKKKDELDRKICRNIRAMKGTIGTVSQLIRTIGHNFGRDVMSAGESLAQATRNIPGFCAHFLPNQKPAGDEDYNHLSQKLLDTESRLSDFLGAVKNIDPAKKAWVDMWFGTGRSGPIPAAPVSPAPDSEGSGDGKGTIGRQ